MSFYFGSICFLQFETLDSMLRPSVLLPNLLANIKPRKNKEWFILNSIWEIKTVLLLTLLRKSNNFLSVLILGKHLRLDHSLTSCCLIFSQPEKSLKLQSCSELERCTSLCHSIFKLAVFGLKLDFVVTQFPQKVQK